jgi:predicted ABC-class ATPase
MKRLKEKIEISNRKSFGFYKSLRGRYNFVDFQLTLQHVQGDPFAAPSLISVSIPQEATGFSEEWVAHAMGRIPLGDFITRKLYQAFSRLPKFACSGNGGRLFMPKPGQQILPRSAVCFEKGQMVVRFRAGLPANGRVINAPLAMELFFGIIPHCIASNCYYVDDFKPQLADHIRIYQQQRELRRLLPDKGLIAFIPDGALLPRRTGALDVPLAPAETVPFKSPPEMACRLRLKDGTEFSGMGIKKGVNLIVGGGFHGKSTLLQALQLGIYCHIRGDGREFVSTNARAVKIRSENGRVVNNVNIEPFIKGLPNGADTRAFSSENASGSTSQAAGIVEMLNMGAEVLLMDEDTCATNFMVRDEKMRRLVADEDEPITPFLYRVAGLYRHQGVSTILVMGGVGDYLAYATEVIGMKNFLPFCLTAKAREVAGLPERSGEFDKTAEATCYTDRRCIRAASGLFGRLRPKVKCNSLVTLRIGELEVDIRNLEQLVSSEQGMALGYLAGEIFSKNRRVAFSELMSMAAAIESNDFSFIREKRGDLAAVRALDLAGVLNRTPGVEIQKEARNRENLP